ncbi:hypothetical protein [Natronobacterium gregoryi]|uniref:Uncharacterized protein n=2 Tax=Natronobacterium gregoryi TaxID=44930 RepID=L0AEJ9_NATGS|nr:hypothetical protein [Natronobacterium gregoryi]AFZ72333.1 hypothetical protein Natgr_1104 [Natronobacterium gregoryi SP2]ELY64282.1 hypothetical protein C490_14875 [Natronobacterium gregoryi SP2]PLK20351.1 hypothetical protein CYV19_10335 [Natronobacterium gregoryi SP2]SFJ23284.1 hypothetical protein SAMN05443661_11865 [Natronobacterium gregoryi]
MVSRENRAIAGSFVLLVTAIAVLTAIDSYTGISMGQHPLPAFLLLVGFAVVVPQLYLAATDDGESDDVSPQARVRFATVAIAAFALLFASDVLLTGFEASPLEDTEALQNLLILAIGAVSLLVLLGYELVAGSRSSGSGETR